VSLETPQVLNEQLAGHLITGNHNPGKSSKNKSSRINKRVRSNTTPKKSQKIESINDHYSQPIDKAFWQPTLT
jgi:hypothetical protein